MRIQVRQIQTMKWHEASCHLLIMGDVHILLDCGISPRFDFSMYRNQQQLIRKVSVILISHSSIEYLGALPFILTQFKITPQIFTTKPISELGPINIHEALLYMRHPRYTPDIYVRICSMFEDTSLKPLQKKVFRLNNETDKKQQSADSIHFTCFNAGNTIGSVCWKISYFMFTCLYLVGYNNYNQYHLLGLDIESIVTDKIDLLITDCYEEEESDKNRQGPRRELLKKQIENKYKIAQAEGKERIIFSCYENQRIIELACVLLALSKEKKMQGKIDFIHVQSLYLQSVRIYPQLEYRMTEQDETVFNTRYMNERRFQSRTVLTTARSIQPQGLLWNELCQQQPSKTTIIRVGQCVSVSPSNAKIYDLFELFEPEKQEVMIVEQKKMQVEIVEPETNQKGQDDVKQIRSDPYIYNNGTFPKFKLKKINNQFDAFGEQYQQPQEIIVEQTVEEETVPQLEKKRSSIEERKRIFFDMPPINKINKLTYDVGNKITFNESLTHFQSSINILLRIKAEKNIFINCDNKNFAKYESRFKTNEKKMQIYSIHNNRIFSFSKPYQVLDLPVKLYKEPSEQSRSFNITNLQEIQAVKVDGELVQIGGQLEIRLHKAEDKQLKQFNMAKFYKTLKKNAITKFTQNGTVQINGVKLSLKKGQIFIEGMYSKQYYELRQMLYDYIKKQ